MDDYRGRCFWFLRPDSWPRTSAEILSVLRHIGHHLGLHEGRPLAQDRELEALPLEQALAGRCVLRADGTLCRSDAVALAVDLEHGRVRFHAGCIRGALPDLMADGGR